MALLDGEESRILYIVGLVTLLREPSQGASLCDPKTIYLHHQFCVLATTRLHSPFKELDILALPFQKCLSSKNFATSGFRHP
jgi:hypothetical protein